MIKKGEKIFFNIKSKGNGDYEGIWTLSDETHFAVIEVMPVSFDDFDKKRQNELIQKMNEVFYSKLDFPIEITIRPVNIELQTKINTFTSLLFYKVKKANSRAMSELAQKFITWLKTYSSKFTKHEYVYYVSVTYKNSGNKISGNNSDDELKQLLARVEFVRNALASVGIKNTKKLSNFEIDNLYNSFFKFNIYNKDTYLLHDEWLNIFKKGEQQDE